MVSQPNVVDAGLFVEVLSCKWTPRVLERLAEGTVRPGQLRRSILGLSTKVLYERLHRLEALGLIESWAFDGYPRRVEYKLTPEGHQVHRMILAWRTAGLRPEEVSEVLKCRWLREILEVLHTGPHRPSQIKRRLGDISNKVLAEKLRKLEHLRLICRRVNSERPLAVWYELSPTGQPLSLFLTALGESLAEPRGFGSTSHVMEAAT